MPRPRKTEKTGSVTATVKEETKTKLEALAKAKGISSRQLVGQILEEYLSSLDNPEDKEPEGYKVGSKVKLFTVDKWKLKREVVTGFRETGRSGVREDKSFFLAHGFIWLAEKYANKTEKDYEAIMEVPDEAIAVFKGLRNEREQQIATLVDTLNEYKNIQSIPGYNAIPLKEDIFNSLYEAAARDMRHYGTPKGGLSHAVSLAINEVNNILRSIQATHTESSGTIARPQEPSEVAPTTEAVDHFDTIISTVATGTVETSGEVLTKDQAAKRFNVAKTALSHLELEKRLDVEGGYLTKRQKPNGYNELVYVSSNTPIAC